MPDTHIQKTPKYEPQLLYIQIIFQDIPRPIHTQITQIYLKVLERPRLFYLCAFDKNFSFA